MARFTVVITSAFKRDLKRLEKDQHEITSLYEEVVFILENDPYNIERKHDIKKLGGVKHGNGQFRMRIGKWRIRYVIEKNFVILYSFKDRKFGY